MRTRGLTVVMAFLLAIGATIAVYLYVQSVRDDAKGKATDMATVIVSKQDIPAQTSLDSMISAGAFTILQIPADAVVNGAVTDVSQLQGKSTAFPILQGEQITTARLQGSSTQVQGGVLGIPAGHKAVTIPLEVPQAVGGAVQAGDHITLYATFDDVQIISGSLKQALEGKGVVDTKKRDIGDFTVTLVPDVQILKAAKPAVGSNDSTVLLTLALTPRDAQLVIFSKEEGKLWVGLLPPGETGTSIPPLSVIEALR
jgi:pilus assembly protein CpaB